MGNYWGYLAATRLPPTRQQTIVVEPMKLSEEEPPVVTSLTESPASVSEAQPKLWGKSTSDQLFTRIPPVILEEDAEKDVEPTSQTAAVVPESEPSQSSVPLITEEPVENDSKSQQEASAKSKKKKNKHNKSNK